MICCNFYLFLNASNLFLGIFYLTFPFNNLESLFSFPIFSYSFSVLCLFYIFLIFLLFIFLMITLSLFDSFFFSLVLLFLTLSFTFAFPPFFVRHFKKNLIRLRKIKVFVLFQRVYRYLLFRVNNAD